MNIMKIVFATLITIALASPTLADADGVKLFKKKCGVCHSVEQGKHKIGPSLYGVVGRQAGITDFKKYKALKNSDVVWTEENIDAWITNPKKFIGKSTAMSVKVKKEKDRKAIIKYLSK